MAGDVPVYRRPIRPSVPASNWNWLAMLYVWTEGVPLVTCRADASAAWRSVTRSANVLFVAAEDCSTVTSYVVVPWVKRIFESALRRPRSSEPPRTWKPVITPSSPTIATAFAWFAGVALLMPPPLMLTKGGSLGS